MGWRNAVGWVGAWVVFDLTLRALGGWGVIHHRYAHAYGPASSAMAWWYHRVLGPQDGRLQRFDPDLGWTNKANERWTSEITVSINGQGLRGVSDEAELPEVGRQRALFFGDSFVFGAEGDDTWLFPVLLEQDGGLDSVNLGVAGYGLDQVWLQYQRDAARWHPELVVVVMSELLVHRCMSDFFLYAKPIVPAEDGVFEPVGLPLPTEEALQWRLTAKPATLSLLQMAAFARQTRSPAWGERAVARSTALLDHFAAEVRRDGAIPVFVWAPPPPEVDAEVAGLARVDLWATMCPSTAVCGDVTAELVAAERAGVETQRGVHWSADGHRAVAAGMRRVLRDIPPH